MRGSVRRPPDPNRPHLANDYRDPPPLKLPLPPKYKMVKKEDELSMKNVKSDEIVWDTLRNLKLMKRGSFASYKALRDRQRSILLHMPHLNATQIRRYTTPVSQHLPQELLEDRYYFAGLFLSYLIDVNDEILENSSDKALKTESISNSPQALELLAKLLKQLDRYLDEGDIENFCSLAFYCAIHFEKKRGHWWLANEFYLLALDMSLNIDYDYGYVTALVNYIYGKFLVIKEKNYISALNCLKVARRITEDKIWDVGWLTGIKNEWISENADYLIHLTLLLLAEEVHGKLPTLAMALAEEAAEVAKKGHWEGEWLEAMFDYLLYCNDAKKLREQVSTINYLEKECLEQENLEMFSRLKLLSAKCHLENNELEKAMACLNNLDNLAKKSELHYLRAQVHRYIGHISILQANRKKAASYLNSAVKINKEFGNEYELSKCKDLLVFPEKEFHGE